MSDEQAIEAYQRGISIDRLSPVDVDAGNDE